MSPVLRWLEAAKYLINGLTLKPPTGGFFVSSKIYFSLIGK